MPGRFPAVSTCMYPRCVTRVRSCPTGNRKADNLIVMPGAIVPATSPLKRVVPGSSPGRSFGCGSSGGRAPTFRSDFLLWHHYTTEQGAWCVAEEFFSLQEGLGESPLWVRAPLRGLSPVWRNWQTRQRSPRRLFLRHLAQLDKFIGMPGAIGVAYF